MDDDDDDEVESSLAEVTSKEAQVRKEDATPIDRQAPHSYWPML